MEARLWADLNLKLVGGRPEGARSVQMDDVVEFKRDHVVTSPNWHERKSRWLVAS